MPFITVSFLKRLFGNNKTQSPPKQTQARGMNNAVGLSTFESLDMAIDFLEKMANSLTALPRKEALAACQELIASSNKPHLTPFETGSLSGLKSAVRATVCNWDLECTIWKFEVSVNENCDNAIMFDTYARPSTPSPPNAPWESDDRLRGIYIWKGVGMFVAFPINNAPSGSKAELITMIEELTEIDQGGLIKTLEHAAKTIAASNRFSIGVVQGLVLESFFDQLPMDVRSPNDVRSASMKIGAAMGGASFAKWLAENVVVGRAPAQMMDSPRKYGSFGMWQDAKELCEKLGVRFG